jgi:hypothetical protein
MKEIRDPVVEEILERMRGQPRPDPERIRAAIREIQERLAKLPVLDSRTPDEIIGYDEFGLPADTGTNFAATDIPVVILPASRRDRRNE